eukprot:m.133644 g.133644  ORF g.133644 m.133644 type:complete len:281 (+) comp29686_c0_seq1:293-1135(+)
MQRVLGCRHSWVVKCKFHRTCISSAARFLTRGSSVEDLAPMGETEMAALLGTKRLPLFPLDLVMFPGQTFPLNVFEPRYKVMFDMILAAQDDNESMLQNGLFGLVCVKPESEVGDVGRTDWRSYTIGTVVKVESIITVERSKDLICSNTSLYRIQVDDVERELLGYWTANASLIPMSGGKLNKSDTDMLSIMENAKLAYAEFLALKELNLSEEDQALVMLEMEKHCEDGVSLSNWLGARWPGSLATKQSLLESSDSAWRLLKLAIEFQKIIKQYSSSAQD